MLNDLANDIKKKGVSKLINTDERLLDTFDVNEYIEQSPDKYIVQSKRMELDNIEKYTQI